MTGILLVSHGNYAQAMLDTSRMILGDQEKFLALGLTPSKSPDMLREEICQAIQALSGDGLLIFTDIASGTPFNTVALLSREYSFRHFTGINLPLLIETLIARPCSSLEELAGSLKEKAASTFMDVDERLKGG
ncbi:MAG: PTS sugar transporter subunit IIA [Lachnospiraceae bacterium]|nr:PTS sugar transporter subunit IIA [Lachnospiraceae bacterium]